MSFFSGLFSSAETPLRREDIVHEAVDDSKIINHEPTPIEIVQKKLSDLKGIELRGKILTQEQEQKKTDLLAELEELQ